MKLADRLVSGQLDRSSPNSQPASEIDPRTAEVLRQYGITPTVTPTGDLSFPSDVDPSDARNALRAMEVERKALSRSRNETNRQLASATRRLQAVYAKWFAVAPVVAIDNVYRWWLTNDVLPEDATVVPRWSSFWCEYHTAPNTQVGVLAFSTENDDPEAEDRWSWELDVFTGDPVSVTGPTSEWTVTADRYGRPLDIRPTAGDPTIAASAVPVWAAALSLLNCKNVGTVKHDPSPGEQRKHRRKRGALNPLVGYHVIRVDVGHSTATTSDRSEQGDDAFHICAGSLCHYGDCCPGTHPPKGKLFGKHTGRFFRAAHAKGNPMRGVRVSDYEVVGLHDVA